MKPIKVKELYPAMAESHDVSLELIEDLSRFYWERIRKELGNLPGLRVHLTNLGDFTIKHWNLEKEINRCKKMLEDFKSRKFIREGMIDDMTTRIEMMENLQELKNQEDQRKAFIHEHKRIYQDAD